MKANEALKQLMELLEEHPDAQILPMVDGEVCCGDEYCWWAGCWCLAEFNEIIVDDWYGDGCVRFRHGLSRCDEETLIEGCAERMFGDCFDEANIEKAKAYIEAAWRPAIVVYIGLPEEEL